jgi:hypothetical protein
MIISVEIMINEQKLIKSDNFTRVNNLSILLVLGILNLTRLSSLILIFRGFFPGRHPDSLLATIISPV